MELLFLCSIRTEIPYLRAAVYYSLFNYLIVNVAIYIH